MITLAHKTVAAIDQAVFIDQGAKYRQILGKLIPDAKDAYEGKKDDFRSHLGASMIGRECSRELWYNFHWAKVPSFEGRMIRLFNRGHLEEPRLVAMLQTIGCQVWCQDEQGNQFRISDVGGHFGSAVDAVLLGCPDLPGEPILGEFKTHNDKSFKKLIASGVKVAKPEHFVQMQIYMNKLQLRFALYLAVNKNDDTLYGEIISYESAVAQSYLDRAHRIILSHGIPDRINESSGFFKCKFCDFNRICHIGDNPVSNCRTCAASVARPDGSWVCTTHNVQLDKTRQLYGCEYYDKKLEFVL